MPVALFIITVLALLVVAMAQLQQSSGESISLQIQSQRAFFAAESGAQVGVGRVMETNNCASVPGAVSFSTSGLNGCSVSLSCQPTNVTIEERDYFVARVTSDAQCGSGPDRANRSVEVLVREE
ncbi:hypothetical protein [Marinobacter zhanjiangensis]|uniref:hypothetical protein n=1 Tax=Marinobacter zhanjiangensis TaxID=578215 RepID=UPI001D1274D1|nr:hypothetical protein [Marinobacter zhanjiangensis]